MMVNELLRVCFGMLMVKKQDPLLVDLVGADFNNEMGGEVS